MYFTPENVQLREIIVITCIMQYAIRLIIINSI